MYYHQDKSEKHGDNIDDLLNEVDYVVTNNVEDELEMPKLDLDLQKVEADTSNQAKYILERLSGYYFDEKYIEEHPYIPCKIQNEMENVRRLLKMLTINEKAQDSIILAISLSMTKSTLYQSLTSLQNSTLSIQKQLDDVVSKLEDIFRLMQVECKKTFEEREKEDDGNGKFIIKGSREFIEEMTTRLNQKKYIKNETQIS